MTTNLISRNLLLMTFAFMAAAVAAQTSSSLPRGAEVFQLEVSQIFTYFMVTLGPLKLLAPFVRMTRGFEEAASRRLALEGIGISCLGGAIAAHFGRNTLEKWGVSLPALLLAAGVVLLLVALRAVLAQYRPTTASSASPAPSVSKPPPGLALSLAFPNIITPHGTAGFILLLAAAPDQSSRISIYGVFLGVMALNLVAMWFAKPILKYAAGFLAIMSSVLGVLQVALAIQLLILSARMLGALPSLHG